MMRLDEAIKLCDEKVEELEGLITEGYISYVSQTFDCKENADNYKRLAEWLRELKKWRALRDSINMLCDVDCEYPQYRESGTMCDACPIGTVKEYFEQIFDGGKR